MTLALTLVSITVGAVGCTNEHDRTDALKAADRIHFLAGNKDFASIYRESSGDFKQQGEESKFIESMKAIFEGPGAGPLKDVKPVAYQSTVDSKSGRQHVLIFDLEFERARGRERLVFIRTESGELQLSEIVIEPVTSTASD